MSYSKPLPVPRAHFLPGGFAYIYFDPDELDAVSAETRELMSSENPDRARGDEILAFTDQIAAMPPSGIYKLSPVTREEYLEATRVR